MDSLEKDLKKVFNLVRIYRACDKVMGDCAECKEKNLCIGEITDLTDSEERNKPCDYDLFYFLGKKGETYFMTPEEFEQYEKGNK